MLILELESNELFNVHVEQLSSMEKTSSLLVNHLHNGISTLIINMNNIPICSRALSTMNPLKLGFVTPFFKIVAFSFCQNIHWAPMYVLRLHIANKNRHYFTIDWFIDVASHSHQP
jgi:hypothetical protein